MRGDRRTIPMPPTSTLRRIVTASRRPDRSEGLDAFSIRVARTVARRRQHERVPLRPRPGDLLARVLDECSDPSRCAAVSAEPLDALSVLARRFVTAFEAHPGANPALRPPADLLDRSHGAAVFGPLRRAVARRGSDRRRRGDHHDRPRRVPLRSPHRTPAPGARSRGRFWGVGGRGGGGPAGRRCPEHPCPDTPVAAGGIDTRSVGRDQHAPRRCPRPIRRSDVSRDAAMSIAVGLVRNVPVPRDAGGLRSSS